MVEANQCDQLEDLLDAEGCRKRVPNLLKERRRVVQLVDHPDEGSFIDAPEGVIRIAVHGRTYLLLRQGDPLGEECDVHAPLVGAAAASTGAVDHDLSVAK